MATFSTFITPEYVYRFSVIDSNIDPNLIQTFIIKAQDINIQTAIGNNLYVKLMNDIAENTLSGYYEILVNDYIQRCQLEWTVYHATPYINYRFTNKSVSEKKSDSSDPTDLKVVQYLREDTRNTAEFLTRRITEYIINNQAQFPEFFQINLINQITPKLNNYFGGIYLKDSPQRRRGKWGRDPIKPFNDECC